jgi:HEAT repeat protein
VPPLESLLADLICGDLARAETAVARLAALGQPAQAGLLPLAHSPDEDIRWWGVRALAEMDSEEARAALRRALDDPEPAVRQAAALGLRRSITPADAPGLLHALHDADALVRRLAGDALAALGPAAVPALSQAADSADACARIEAVRALARCGSPDALPALMAALEDPSSLVLHWAEQGLEDLGPSMIYLRP